MLERWVFDVSGFPVVEKGEALTDFEITGSSTEGREKGKDAVGRGMKGREVDLEEQFRAVLVRLGTAAGRLAPLPEGCEWTLAMEVRDEGEQAQAPVGWPQPWMPVEPGLQKKGRRGGEEEEMDEADEGFGKDRGGKKAMPVRKIAAGVMRMEVWVEEGKGKFEGEGTEDPP